MPRELTPEVKTELTAATNRPAFLFEGVFSSGAIRTWTGHQDITHSSFGANLFSKGEELDDTNFWSYTNVTITADDTAAPDGTTTADRIDGDATAARHAATQNGSESPPVAADVYRVSGYIKKSVGQYAWFGEGGDAQWHGVAIDLDAGTITNDSGYVVSSDIQAASNSWYYVEVTFTRINGSGNNTGYVAIHGGTSGTAPSSALDATGLQLFAWGIKLEKVTSSNFQGNGWLVGITSPTETGNIQAASMEVELSGVPSTTRSIVLNNTNNSATGKLWFAMLDSTRDIISSSYLLFSGLLNGAQIVEAAGATDILLPYETRLAKLKKRKELRYTNEQQQERYPGDVGLEYVAQAQTWSGYWGTGETVKNFRRRDRR